MVWVYGNRSCESFRRLVAEAQVEGLPFGLAIVIRFPTNPRLVWLRHPTPFGLRGPSSDSYRLDV